MSEHMSNIWLNIIHIINIVYMFLEVNIKCSINNYSHYNQTATFSSTNGAG